MFPLFEYVNGKFTLSKPSKTVPVTEYLDAQNRFSHLSTEEKEEIQKDVDGRWSDLMKMEKND